VDSGHGGLFVFEIVSVEDSIISCQNLIEIIGLAWQIVFKKCCL
jgi:hypothetical protein